MVISRRQFVQTSLAISARVAMGAAGTPLVLGLIAPPEDYPVPPEALTLYQSQVRFSVFGLGLKTMTPEGYDSVIDKIVPAAQKLTKQGASAMVIFGTSLTFYKGAAFNQKLIDDVRKATGLKTTSMSSAVVDGLKTLGGRRIAVATAYGDEVNGRLRTFLGECGFEVLALKGLGLEAIDDPGKISQTELKEFGIRV